jgi:CRP/FNR family transcriptional regulator, cyclic AMP receptor protein
MQGLPPTPPALPPTGFWAALSDGERTALSARGRESVFARGTPLCMEGDPSTHLLVLLTGWAKVISSTVEGNEMFLALRGPGDVIGELAGDLSGYRTATVRALMKIEALLIGAERFNAFLEAHPGAVRAYRRVMAARQHELGENLRIRMDSSGAQRLARLLLDLAARCGRRTERGVALAVPLSQVDLASWVGVSRATVTRALQDWRKRGLVSTQPGLITIINPDELQRIGGALAGGR